LALARLALPPAFIKLGPLSSGELSSPITIALDRAAGIVIRVVDSSDRAIQGVSLHLGGDKRGPIQGTTNHAGELRLGDLAPAPLMLTATHPGFMTRTVEVLPANPPAQSEIVLAQGGRIEGSVSFGNDAVPNALVVAGALGRDGFEKTVSTNGAGEFRIAGLPPGEAEVFVDLPQGEKTDAPVSRLQKRVLLEHKIITRIEFRFPIETSSLEGVIRVGGQAPASATLRGTIVGGGGDSFFYTESRADGFYRVDGLLPGDAWIEVVAITATGSDRRRNFELAIPEGALIRHDIEVRGQGMITGIVLGLDEGETGEVMVLPASIALNMSNPRSFGSWGQLCDAT
jgi:hypothetical protein